MPRAPVPGATARDRWDAWTGPRPDGLPRVRVLLAYPALLLVVLVGLVAAGLSGTSTGVVHGWFEEGADGNLVAFEPQAIRSDEWSVQTTYTVSQVQEGLPLHNDTLPGGVDMSLNWEAPYAEWSAAFRPHNLGFFVLPFDQAFALKWWLPGLALAAAAYMLLVSVLPRRPLASAALATAFLFSPFFQWWYIPQTLWPVAWALLTMTAIVWTTALAPARARWLWALPVGYVTVTAALGIYAPFLIPVAYVTAAFGVGWVLRRDGTGTVRDRLRRVLPVLAGGAAGGVVVVVFLLTRWSTIEGFLGTVYPGQRLTPPGEALADPDRLAGFLGVFSLALHGGGSHGIRPNSSEASTFVFLGAFVALGGVWLLLHLWRTRCVVDAPLVAALACGVLFAAFLYVPGWAPIAHLLLLDRATPGRMLIGLGLLSLLLVALVVRALDVHDLRAPWWVAVAGGVVVLGSHAVLADRLSHRPGALEASGPWWLFALVLAAAVVLVLRRRLLPGAVAYLALSLVFGAWVNPLYRGVFDLRETDVAQAVSTLDEQVPGRWVGVGDAMVGPILTATGVGAFNAFQGAPDVDTWQRLDPSGRYEVHWNRFGNVGWIVDDEAPRISNPAPDQVRVNFDSCARYEQSEITHVLSDRPIEQPCLRLVDEVDEPVTTFHIYQVVARP
ncbi:hypothetical protein ACFFGJ_13775 [Cellulomonas phragmiteti]|uniref:Glycosyltransferase RgtA/B/C/D-like domain-containing protein n=1 Tax=Cellulomonas phragmiteti TaxID=478780 RepID=A0ABQ4DJT7_9CELL|nr:hypothetical protein Cph01nite_13720 [Cellulomonas phragmiteti]